MLAFMNDTMWAALVDPRRRAVLDLLTQGELSVGELVERLGLTQPQTSKHLRVLRDAGLVRVEQRAQQRIYAVDPRPMVELDRWLAPYRRLWNASLDRLGDHLAHDDDRDDEGER
jgi:DNA-binding transcriptional ArsR family regulator